MKSSEESVGRVVKAVSDSQSNDALSPTVPDISKLPERKASDKSHLCSLAVNIRKESWTQTLLLPLKQNLQRKVKVKELWTQTLFLSPKQDVQKNLQKKVHAKSPRQSQIQILVLQVLQCLRTQNSKRAMLQARGTPALSAACYLTEHGGWRGTNLHTTVI
ncbi:hypothetical protein LDENG_00105230 [Lucifuga dentata]|nr:hypothetical protein LDENG_00105230 [Lucifuga dentata]